MSERIEPEGWSGVEAIVEIGLWDHEGAPHGTPWPGTTRVPVSSVYADGARTELIAFEDGDGCRAPLSRIVFKRRVVGAVSTSVTTLPPSDPPDDP